MVRVASIVPPPVVKHESSVPMNTCSASAASTDPYWQQTMHRHVPTFAPSREENERTVILEDTGVVNNGHAELKLRAAGPLAAIATQKTSTPYRPAPAATPTRTVDALTSIPAHRFRTHLNRNTGHAITINLVSVYAMRRTTEDPRFCYKIPSL